MVAAGTTDCEIAASRWIAGNLSDQIFPDLRSQRGDARMTSQPTALRSLPSVDRLLRHPSTAALLSRYSRRSVTATLRKLLEQTRTALGNGSTATVPTDDALVKRAAEQLTARAAPPLRPLINATGVVLHTNLGRAGMAAEVIAAVSSVAAHATNLEYELETGSRGDRDIHIEPDLCALTGAEAATAVNNNAAAVLLALNTLAEGREVVVSRGELVEIGGSFRLPDILAKSGALLREVGTTNRTHPDDYERAVGSRTALLLKVHPSNYQIQGFTSAVPLDTLVQIGRAHDLPVMEDLGSGALIDLASHGLPHEPVVADRVRLGADVVTFSGDKLLGGPQAGILVGRRQVIDRIRQNPLKRALRCGKLTVAALSATLRLYQSAPDLVTSLPTLRLLTRSLTEMESVGSAAVALLAAALGSTYHVEMCDAESEIGSGALPTETIPSKAIVVTHPHIAPLDIAARFRASDPPIAGRVHENRFWLDLRCIWEPTDLVPKEPTK